MNTVDRLMSAMIDYYSGDPKRIQHFIKVHSFARLIGLEEGLDAETLFTLESAALVHDIGIRICEEKYGGNTGKQQEAEGPAPAREMLEQLGYPPQVTDRVCFLVGHHHTYSGIEGADYQILVEADFLVNLYEDGLGRAEAESVLNRIFKTPSGRKLLKTMFLTPA